MKKTFSIFSITVLAFTLTAFAFVNWNTKTSHTEDSACCTPIASSSDVFYPFDKSPKSDFIYDVGSRFATAVTKEKLAKAKTIIDILPEQATSNLRSYQNVKIAAIAGENEIVEFGENEILNEAQLKLLASLNYSTNFYINADCKSNNIYKASLENYDLVYYMTIVPENEAKFKYGKQALIDYLRENSKNEIAHLEKADLRPGKLHFTIKTNGSIDQLKLASSSGHKDVDAKMKELILSLSGDWIPASNSKGEGVEQELVFSFGIMGC